MKRICIRIGVFTFEVPEEREREGVALVQRLQKAADYMNAAAEAEPDGYSGDLSHLADAVDAIETLANFRRRAKASQRPQE